MNNNFISTITSFCISAGLVLNGFWNWLGENGTAIGSLTAIIMCIVAVYGQIKKTRTHKTKQYMDMRKLLK